MRYLFVFLIILLSHSANAGNCETAHLVKPAPFMGNSGEIFRLDNGLIGEVVGAYEYLYAYYPEVIICRDSKTMIVDGGIKQAKISYDVISEKHEARP